MALSAGDRLGSYEILEPLGAGGMGEVYRATDTKLARDVAIKILPGEVAKDPERLQRFQREAHLLASLNHPHIAGIHGLEEANGHPFLVLELVEGEDLKQRLDKGPTPVNEALEIAEQIAEALEEAHNKGIVHRDLKPANVKLTPEGKVKVLDFGLAKAWAGDAAEGPSSSAAMSQSPTLAHTGTAAGVILGTAAYMSPEQAMGKAVDKRADIWAFGVVLFEMLTGEQVFSGENASEILASIIKEEPDWEQLPQETPGSVTRLLRRCLRKKPRERLQDIGDARLEMEEGRREPADRPVDPGRGGVGGRAAGRERLAWGMAAVLAVATAGLAVRSHLSGAGARGPLQLSVPLAPAQLAGRSFFAISPDGSTVAFPGEDGDGGHRLYVRALDEPAARGLPDTEDAVAPFFSPDGQWVAFFVGNTLLKKVPVNGGPVLTVTEGTLRSSRGTWTEDGWIVVTQPTSARAGELLRVQADGGPLEPVKVSGDGAQEAVHTVTKVWGHPALLLGIGRGLADPESVAVAVQSLGTGQRRVLAPGGVLPRYLASGHIVYRHSGRLIASRLDAERMEITGMPVPLEVVTPDEEVDHFDLSPSGVLVFVSSPDDSQQARLAWTDRAGNTAPLAFDEVPRDPRLSPDGTRVAIGADDVWILDLDRGTRTRISSAAGEDETPTWSPDGRWVAWAATRPKEARTLYRRRSDGSGPEERLWSDDRHFHVASRSQQGLVLTVQEPTTGWDVLLLDPDDPAEARPLLNATFNEHSARVSPDGRLIAFVSDETGRNEVYVRAFPDLGGKVQVSVGGGVQPVWRPGTREIVYRGSGQIMSVTLGAEDPPTVSAPRALMEDHFWGSTIGGDHTWYAVHGDGRLLVAQASEQAPRREIRIVFDWMEAAGLRP